MLFAHSDCPSLVIIEVDYSLKLGGFDCEPEDFLNTYEGRIIDADTGLLVGRIRAIVAGIENAYNHNMGLIDVLDGSSCCRRPKTEDSCRRLLNVAVR